MRKTECRAVRPTIHTPTTMSLLGLVGHLAEEERHLRRVMAGENKPKLYCSEENRDGDLNGATHDPEVVEDAWRQWRAEMELTDQYVAESPTSAL